MAKVKPKFRIVANGPFVEVDTELVGEGALNRTLKSIRQIHTSGLLQRYGRVKRSWSFKNQDYVYRKVLPSANIVSQDPKFKLTVSVERL